MGTSAVVSVYEVEALGGTGALIGTGWLVHPLLVRLDAPVDGRLTRAGGTPPRLRLGIGPVDGAGFVVDVVDAVAVHVAVMDGEPFVAVSLPRPARPAVQIPNVSDRRSSGDAHRERLGDEVSDHLGADLSGDDQLSWPCRLFKPPPWFCGVPEPEPEPSELGAPRGPRAASPRPE